MSKTLAGNEGRVMLNVGRQFPTFFRKYFEMNRIFSVALVYCDKMSTVASLGTKGEIKRQRISSNIGATGQPYSSLQCY